MNPLHALAYHQVWEEDWTEPMEIEWACGCTQGLWAVCLDRNYTGARLPRIWLPRPCSHHELQVRLAEADEEEEEERWELGMDMGDWR